VSAVFSCFLPFSLSVLTALANSNKGSVNQTGWGFATLEIARRSLYEQGRKLAMSMKPQEISPVPEETARVARAANPTGNV
jgi:hypothetical protein